MKEFTRQQIADFKAYRKVQRGGKYNMMTQASIAMRMAGLTRDEYMFVIENYEALALQTGEEK